MGRAPHCQIARRPSCIPPLRLSDTFAQRDVKLRWATTRDADNSLTMFIRSRNVYVHMGLYPGASSRVRSSRDEPETVRRSTARIRVSRIWEAASTIFADPRTSLTVAREIPRQQTRHSCVTTTLQSNNLVSGEDPNLTQYATPLGRLDPVPHLFLAPAHRPSEVGWVPRK
jgi:hypothetical protein